MKIIPLYHHYDTLEMCGGVCICRDPSLCLYFLILQCSERFWASTFGRCTAPSQKWRAECEVRDSIKNTATSYQIARMWDHQKRVRFELERTGQL